MNDQTLRKIDGEHKEKDSSVEQLQHSEQVTTSRRPRSMTTLKLQWLAERVRRCRQIEEQIKAGTYKVESKQVAKAVLGIYEEE